MKRFITKILCFAQQFCNLLCGTSEFIEVIEELTQDVEELNKLIKLNQDVLVKLYKEKQDV